eukprot:TRINITY_DN2818_c1_g1_i1.p1 TRINITY_DN2818_c1_g1~~TRINITY_DN2818_c1_g1_i1.p1  ORF type:complete len:609 (+),score=158.09 TRINITY_DN2818_c1_g1_i1:52-1878(+)
MSVHIDWSLVGDEEAQQATEFLNDFFAKLPDKPEFIGDTVVSALSLGTEPPVIRILNISDPESITEGGVAATTPGMTSEAQRFNESRQSRTRQSIAVGNATSVSSVLSPAATNTSSTHTNAHKNTNHSNNNSNKTHNTHKNTHSSTHNSSTHKNNANNTQLRDGGNATQTITMSTSQAAQMHNRRQSLPVVMPSRAPIPAPNTNPTDTTTTTTTTRTTNVPLTSRPYVSRTHSPFGVAALLGDRDKYIFAQHTPTHRFSLPHTPSALYSPASSSLYHLPPPSSPFGDFDMISPTTHTGEPSLLNHPTPQRHAPLSLLNTIHNTHLKSPLFPHSPVRASAAAVRDSPMIKRQGRDIPPDKHNTPHTTHTPPHPPTKSIHARGKVHVQSSSEDEDSDEGKADEARRTAQKIDRRKKRNADKMKSSFEDDDSDYENDDDFSTTKAAAAASGSSTTESADPLIASLQSGELDVEFTVLLKYSGNARLTLRTELVINMPGAPRFVRLPIEVTISDIVLKGRAHLINKEGRVMAFFERDRKDTEASPLKNFTVEIKIGDQSQGQIANVKQVEEFIVTALKKQLIEVFVHPNYFTVFDAKTQPKATTPLPLPFNF